MTEGIRKSENGEIGGKCVFLGTNEGAGCAKARAGARGVFPISPVRACGKEGGHIYRP